MNRIPTIGEGVLVPWGVDSAPGEVIDLRGSDHVVVAVPVEGSMGETLDSVHATFNIAALQEMPRWRVERTRAGSPSPSADADSAWYVDAERNGDTAHVEVRVSSSLSASRQSALPDEARRALATKGRSAVEKFASRYRLPRVIVIGTTGVFELRA